MLPRLLISGRCTTRDIAGVASHNIPPPDHSKTDLGNNGRLRFFAMPMYGHESRFFKRRNRSSKYFLDKTAKPMEIVPALISRRIRSANSELSDR